MAVFYQTVVDCLGDSIKVVLSARLTAVKVCCWVVCGLDWD